MVGLLACIELTGQNQKHLHILYCFHAYMVVSSQQEKLKVPHCWFSSCIGLILDLFHKLEEEHGHLLVGHMIAYVTASRHGLTETELLDILCCDHEVRFPLAHHWTVVCEAFSVSLLCSNFRWWMSWIGTGVRMLLRQCHLSCGASFCKTSTPSWFSGLEWGRHWFWDGLTDR